MEHTVDPAAMRRLKAPHSTLERIGQVILPESVYRFLFSQSDQFPAARRLLGALFGAVSGAGLCLGLAHNLPLTSDLRLTAGCVFVAVCILGAALSSYFRCAVLLMFPSMLSSSGRTYMTVFILSALYSGPVSNIQRNVQDVALSLGCNMDLQVQHSTLMWRAAMEPFIQMAQDIVDDNAEFQEEARSVSRKFQNIRDEVMGQYGYDQFKPHPVAMGNSTQEQFAAKTMMQCDAVVEQGIERCRDWFQVKWQECMETVKAPVINHILCVSMRFHFLCDVMRVMTPWCRDQIPVEGNFGQTFDKLNLSIDLLSREFSAQVVVQEEEQQSVFGGALLRENFTQSLKRSFQEAQAMTDQLLDLLQLLLSFTFITTFISAFGYVRQYRNDVLFDNVYITTYFRQIDARRRRAGKHFLLPLRTSEKNRFILPWSLSILPTQLKPVTLALLQVLSLGLLSCVLLAVDLTLYHMLDILRRHTFTQFNLTSGHHVDIQVRGDSMMARLLRKTITAFNSSSTLDMHTTNQNCLLQPTALSTADYWCSTAPILLMVLMCCLQVYSNRLRRVIAAFYFPKREKRRVLFLYNLQLQDRIWSTSRGRRRLASLGQTHRTVWSSGVGWCLDQLDCRLRRRGGCPSSGCHSPPCYHDDQNSTSDTEDVFYVCQTNNPVEVLWRTPGRSLVTTALGSQYHRLYDAGASGQGTVKTGEEIPPSA
ncbi:E3 ubiquitin-protein ligase DCST1 [Polymixia lowei]